MTQHTERETTLRLDCCFSAEQIKFINKRLLRYQILCLKAYKYNKKHYIPNGVNSILKIVKIIDISNRNSDFLPILGINLQQAQEHHLQLTAMIVPETITSLRALITMRKKGQCSQQLESVINFLRARWNEVVKQYCKELSWFEDDCYDIYLQQQNQTYNAVIGLNNFRLSHSHKSAKQLEQIFGYQANTNIALQYSNQFLSKIESSFPAKIQSSQSLPFLHSFFAKYTQNICDFLAESLNFGLTRRIYEDRLLNGTQSESISMIDRRTGTIFQGEIYHNLHCMHFEGNSMQTFEQMLECPFCGNKIVYDKEEMQLYCQDVFQQVLLNNFMNRDKQDVDYYFKNNAFTLKFKGGQPYRQRFSGYHHFQMYVERCKEEKSRDHASVINQHETISLYNKLKRQQKIYSIDQLIDCPVRGKFCKHWQFYDLRRVYSAMMASNDEYFECFVCCKEVHFQQILYLKEMKQIIKLAHLYAECMRKRKNVNASLKLDHQSAKVKLILTSTSLSLKYQIIQVMQPSFSMHEVANRYAQLNLRTILKQFHHKKSLLKLEPCPQLGDLCSFYQYFLFFVEFFTIAEALLVDDCKDLAPSVDQSRFFEYLTIDKAIFHEAFREVLTLLLESFVFVHYLKFFRDDSGQDVVRIREFIIQLVSGSSEDKLFTSPIQFHFEGIFSTIREDDFELINVVVRAFQCADGECFFFEFQGLLDPYVNSFLGGDRNVQSVYIFRGLARSNMHTIDLLKVDRLL